MCEKVTYPTRRIAKERANYYRKNGAKRSRPYHCQECNLWHLSARSRRISINIDRNESQLRYKKQKENRNQ